MRLPPQLKAFIKKVPRRSRRRSKGQGLVEMALLFPLMLIVLSGLIEFGFLLNDYLAILDAARNAARFSSDSLWETWDNEFKCSETTNFFRQTFCLVCQELDQERPPINAGLDDLASEVLLRSDGSPFNCPLDATQDQVVVSVASINAGTGTILFLPSGQRRLSWLPGRIHAF